MKSRHLVVLNGHPDPGPDRFCAGLCRSYMNGARRAGWATTLFNIGQLFGDAAATTDLALALKATCAAERLAIVYPVWLGSPPENLAYFSRLARALSPECLDKITTHVIATMDMPGLLYRNQTKRNEWGQIVPMVVCLPGMPTTKHTLIGSVSAISASQRAARLAQMDATGYADMIGHGAHTQKLSA